MSKAERSCLLSSFRENVLLGIKQISDAGAQCTEAEQSILMTYELLWQFEA